MAYPGGPDGSGRRYVGNLRKSTSTALLPADPSITMTLLETRRRQSVRGYTAMSDPTAGGQLVDAVVAVHRASHGTQAPGFVTGDETGFARCVVSVGGSRLLKGSLLGLGDRPVPWSS